MYLKGVTETILTSFLLLSRVWARPSDVVCDGQRGEGDKWFDGCRWCVCHRSGPQCSSSKCSHLVSRVLPCQKVDSRWLDGCYYCKCHRHGIECTANETCIILMQNERIRAHLLSIVACVNIADDRCVCGVDGVPSCSAEVIDRNAYPATTIGLNPVFPASSGLVIPKVVYYERPFKKHDLRDNRIRRPQNYNDSPFPHYKDKNQNTPINEHNRRRHLVKRHSSNHRRHSPEIDNGNEDWSQVPEYEHLSTGHISFNQQNSKKNFANSEKRSKILQMRTNTNSPDIMYARDARTAEDGQFYKNNKQTLFPGVRNYIRQGGISKRIDVFGGNYIKQWNNGKKVTRREIQLERVYGSSDLRNNADAQKGRKFKEMYMNDGSVEGNRTSAPSSLLIASDNRCRWGVRWYGGSLRCYCDIDNSITCGDPSFVATRIDGFRVEIVPCEEGHVWESDDSCRECECPISGFVLCRRSPSCLLPFLIKPLPIDADDDNMLDRNDNDIGWKGQLSVGQTDEFTGQEEQKIDWVKPQTETEPTIQDTDSVDGVIIGDTTDDKLNFPIKKWNDLDEISNSNNNNNKSADLELGDNFLGSLIGSTLQPNNVISSNEIPENQIVDFNIDKDNDGGDNKIEQENKGIKDIVLSDFKRTTQIIPGECKPKSRWLDGCKRCECDQDGRKHCDDSRCLKPMSVSMDITNVSSESGHLYPHRPVQRPPDGLFLSRYQPVDLSPPFLLTNLCGRFTIGQKYWDECNACICTSHGPKCTAKNCA